MIKQDAIRIIQECGELPGQLKAQLILKKYENYNYGKNSPYNLEIHIEDFTDEIM